MAVVKVEDAEFSKLLSEEDKIVVKFYADWCGSCRLMAPKFKKMSNDESFSGVTFLEVNAEDNPETRKLAEVANLPTIATFKGGKLLESIATSKKEAVAEMIAKLQN